MRLSGLVVALAFSAATAWGCGEDRSKEAEPQAVAGLWERDFVSSAVVEEGKPRPLVPGSRIDLDFTGPKDSGIGWNAGCNGHGAPVQISAEKLHLGPIAGTLMGCQSALEKQDDWLAEFFESNPTWELEGNRLTLVADGTTIEFES